MATIHWEKPTFSGCFHCENKTNNPSEKLVTTHQTTRCLFSEQHDLNLDRHMNLKFQIKISSLKLLRPFYLMRPCSYLGSIILQVTAPSADFISSYQSKQLCHGGTQAIFPLSLCMDSRNFAPKEMHVII